MTGPRTVAVMGSCITRDNFNSRFNPDYKLWYQVGATTNQSSMIALMSPPVDEPWEPVRPMKDYGAWNVRSDLTREILGLLAQDPPDLLILDFFGDVHFGVLRMHDGRFLTNNRWRIHKTDLYQRLIEDERTEVVSWQDDADDEYFSLWTDAMDRFAAFMADQCPTTRVVVHCGFNATQVMRPGLPIPGRLRPASREARRVAQLGNDFWARIDAHARTSYGWDHIDLRNESYASTKEHPWGAFEVHYTMDYYHRFLAELHRVALRDQLPPELTARVEAIGDAAAARVSAELTYWQELDAALAKARTRDEDRPPGWRRLFGRRSSGDDEPSPPEDDLDRRLLAELRELADEKIFAQVVQLADSADERVAWIRGAWEARIAHRFPDRNRA